MKMNGTLLCIASLALAGTARGTLIAYWNMNEASAPYANAGSSGGSLGQDAGTDAAGTGSGIDGAAAHLQYTGGTSTRLVSGADAQTGNSFGFSLYINPQYISAGDVIMASEATGGSISTRGFDYWNWAIRAVTVGSGLGLEFIVRGQGGAGNEGYASQVSGQFLQNGGDQSGHWYHLAGGYDAGGGGISLFVRDMTSDSSATAYNGSGDSGLTTHGAGLSLGTVQYNGGYVNYAANTYVDEVRVFDTALTDDEVASLEVVPEPSAALLFGLGAIGFVGAVRRRAIRRGA